MSDDIFYYFTDLPPGINEMVTPCADGYTVYIDQALDDAHRSKAYAHAEQHVLRDDFAKYDVQEIEKEAHK